MAFIPPRDLTQQLNTLCIAKTRLTIPQLLILGFLAGAYIGFAAHLATVISTGSCAWFGAKKFLAGAVFSLGLMLVIIPGSELWTGNTLMTASLFEGDIRLGQMMKNWCIVYCGNLAGAAFLAWMIAGHSGLLDSPVGTTALTIAVSKTTPAAGWFDHQIAYFIRGICCNWLVCLAVLLALAAQDIAGKILGIFFPIMAFVASGFEHAIANMYFIPAGIIAKNSAAAVQGTAFTLAQLDQLTPVTMWTNNLISVSLGNLVGGGLFVASLYWWCFSRRQGRGEQE
ncbi:MAG: formate/nitrite transporter family protein [Desulfuromonadaceae bacterium]|nr:formate/nitrite transporter family protein [Desulfuromonadaceae bacterium]